MENTYMISSKFFFNYLSQIIQCLQPIFDNCKIGGEHKFFLGFWVEWKQKQKEIVFGKKF